MQWNKKQKAASEAPPAGSLQRKRRVVVDERGVIDLPFLILTLILVVIGLVMLFSASFARAYNDEGNSAFYFRRQAIFAAAGIVAMLFISHLNYQLYQRYAMLLYGGCVFLLLLVPFIGIDAGGAKRWLYIGTNFQPSELAKLGVIFALANAMAINREKMSKPFFGILLPGLLLLPVVLLLALQPHLSAIVIICAVGAFMMMAGGTKMRYFVVGFLTAAALIAVLILTKGYASARISAWRNPTSDAAGDGYQILQSQYAIGSGGLLGLGFGKGRQKYMYLPEEHNDYIFAIVCEELGYIGAAAVILLFVMLIVRGYWIALHTEDRFAMLTVFGITTLLAMQVFLNIGVVSNFLPPTGISLPFFSYGGTALMLQLAQMGIVLGISRWNTNQ